MEHGEGEERAWRSARTMGVTPIVLQDLWEHSADPQNKSKDTKTGLLTPGWQITRILRETSYLNLVGIQIGCSSGVILI